MKKFFAVTPVGTLDLSRAVRRIFVALMYGVYFSLITCWHLLSEASDTHLWLTLAGVVAFIVCYFVLNAATKGLADRFRKDFTNQELDERQHLLRNQAYFWAYLVLGVVMFFLLIVADTIGVSWALMALGGLYMSLPTAIIAWLEPDPISKETFEERTLA